MSSLLIFDGECRLCLSIVRRLNRFDGMKRVSTLSSQSEAGREALVLAGMETAGMQSIVLIEPDRSYIKSDAVLTVLGYGRWGRLPARLLKLLPRRLRDKIYDFVAARRYTVFGRVPACDWDR